MTAAPELTEREFCALLKRAYNGEIDNVLAAVDQDGSLATRADKNSSERTLLHCSAVGGDGERAGYLRLARGLLARGASVMPRDWLGQDPTFLASQYGEVALVTLLLDHGGDPCTRASTGYTALGVAAARGRLAVCLLLLSRGADLKALMFGVNALERYGEYLSLSPEVLAEHRAILEATWRAGPHPTQVKRRKDENWIRRWPAMQVAVFNGYQPLAYRRTQLAIAALPPSASIPPDDIRTPEQRRAVIMGKVLANPLLWQIVVSYI